MIRAHSQNGNRMLDSSPRNICAASPAAQSELGTSCHLWSAPLAEDPAMGHTTNTSVDGRPRTGSNLQLPEGKMRQGWPKAQPALARAQPLFIYCPVWSRAKRPSTTACHQEHSQSPEQRGPECPPGDSGGHIYIQGKRGEPDTLPLVLGRIS